MKSVYVPQERFVFRPVGGDKLFYYRYIYDDTIDNSYVYTSYIHENNDDATISIIKFVKKIQLCLGCKVMYNNFFMGPNINMEKFDGYETFKEVS